MQDKPNIKAWRVYDKTTGEQVDVVFFPSDCNSRHIMKVIERDYARPITLEKRKRYESGN